MHLPQWLRPRKKYPVLKARRYNAIIALAWANVDRMARFVERDWTINWLQYRVTPLPRRRRRRPSR